MVDLSRHEAQERLGALVKRTASTRERVTISEAGHPAAVLVNAEELAEIDEALALARYREAQDRGQVHLVAHVDARERLGLVGPASTES